MWTLTKLYQGLKKIFAQKLSFVFNGKLTLAQTPNSTYVEQAFASTFTVDGANPKNELTVTGPITFNAIANFPDIPTGPADDGSGSAVQYDIYESGATASFAFASTFQFAGGNAPSAVGVDGSKHVFMFTPMSDGTVFVSFASDIKVAV